MMTLICFHKNLSRNTREKLGITRNCSFCANDKCTEKGCEVARNKLDVALYDLVPHFFGKMKMI